MSVCLNDCKTWKVCHETAGLSCDHNTVGGILPAFLETQGRAQAGRERASNSAVNEEVAVTGPGGPAEAWPSRESSSTACR